VRNESGCRGRGTRVFGTRISRADVSASGSHQERGFNRWRLVRDYRGLCAQHLENRQGQLSSTAVWTSLVFLLVAGGVDVFLRRRQRAQESHNEIIDTVKAQTRTEIIMGDVYRNISNSSLIVRSTLKDAIQKNDIDNPDLSLALGEIAKVIGTGGSKDAADHLNMLTSELAKPEPNKSLLRTIWGGLKDLAPLVKDSVETVAAIEKVIA
jgi:hypothetical protein